MTPVQQTLAVNKLIAEMEPKIQAAFLLAFKKVGKSLDMTKLVNLLKVGDVWAASEMFRFDVSVMYPLEEAIRATYVAAGSLVVPPLGLVGVFSFNGRHIRAEQWTAKIGSDRIQGIVEDTLVMARETITEGLAAGFTPVKVGRVLTGSLNPSTGFREGGFLGLTTQQRASIVNGMTKLASGDPNLMSQYLTLALRDKSFDPYIKRAIATGTKLPAAMLNRIQTAHNNKALKYRGQVIAKNETFTAQSAGRDEAYRQLIDRQDVEDVTARWQHNLSQKPRPEHVIMGGKPPISLKRGEKFEFPDASMRYPHDPAGGAGHSVGCRCIAVYRVVLEKD